MKKILLMLVMLFVLTGLMVNSASALGKPLDEIWIPSGDDHPWGGDDGGGGTSIEEPSYEPISYTITYSLLSDLFINFFSDRFIRTLPATRIYKEDRMIRSFTPIEREPITTVIYSSEGKGSQ